VELRILASTHGARSSEARQETVFSLDKDLMDVGKRK